MKVAYIGALLFFGATLVLGGTLCLAAMLLAVVFHRRLERRLPRDDCRAAVRTLRMITDFIGITTDYTPRERAVQIFVLALIAASYAVGTIALFLNVRN